MTPEQLADLDTAARQMAGTHLRALLATPGRFATHSRRLGPLLLDLSKQKWD